jgi:hypothetical protein
LTVSKRKLQQALSCEGRIAKGGRQPLIFSTGTGTTGREGLSLVGGALTRLGRPVCAVDFPDMTTADIQVSAQYLVHAIRVLSRRARQPVAIYGISQGALLPRWALTYWPSLRRKVSDVVAVAGTQHGTTAFQPEETCSAYGGCAPALWQQAAGSNLLRHLNDGRDESPGRTSWTTVRSATDETVQPADGPSPTSSLKGASNVLIQGVCAGRATSHIAAVIDSVSIDALRDAITHRGPARVSRLARDVCARPYGPGVDPAFVDLALELVTQTSITQRLLGLPRVLAEPPVARYARR